MLGTELRWMRFISHTVLQIEPVLLKFDDDFRERPGASREEILGRYKPISEAACDGLDGLIVTGDNQELDEAGEVLPFEDILYAEQLRELIDWADDNVYSTIYSCLASHFALNYKHGLERNKSKDKVFGVYSHEVVGRESNLVDGVDDVIESPHSRWCDVPISDVVGVCALRLVALNERIGWLVAEEETKGGVDVYLQGHPEYWRSDLHREYQRDQASLPENYYRYGTQLEPRLTWANDARALHSNWIAGIYHNYSKASD